MRFTEFRVTSESGGTEIFGGARMEHGAFTPYARENIRDSGTLPTTQSHEMRLPS